MGRGRYWEVTYKEQAPALVPWSLQRSSDLDNETGKTKVEVNADKDTTGKGTRAVNLKKKAFEICDFNHFNLEDSSFDDCTFNDCRFVKANFINVKFARCHFETCHFLNVEFRKCQFIDCTFSNLSASAEHLIFVETGISAIGFVGALVTNTAALPPDVSKEYQQFRHRSTKAKIARAIFISVREEPELDQLFDANRSFEIALQEKRIADAHWTANGRELVKRNILHRWIVLPYRLIELGLMRMAGFFTNWGRSPLKSGWFLASAVLAFTAVYALLFHQNLGAAFLRALDGTFVFGYTRYQLGTAVKPIDYVMFVTAFAGLWWYALLVPALSKRLFR